MKSNKIYFIFTISLIALSCQQKIMEVKSLSNSVALKVAQNLKNNRLPTPKEIESNTVPIVPNACETFKTKIPSDWLQGSIEVPEDPNNIEGQKIKIFYYGKIKEGSIPTIFFNGGPGADSHGSFRNLTNSQIDFDPKKQISFVFIDQRGNGCSDFYPQMPAAPASDEAKLAILNRLRFYGSRGIVSDSEFVRKKIFPDKKWNVFGQSYGGFIVHRYVLMAPKNVNAAFSHANVIQSDAYQRMLNRVSSQARVMEMYFTQYPEDRVKLNLIRDLLKTDVCFENEDKSNKLCGYEVIESLTGSLGFSAEWETIHQWVGIMVPEDEVSLEGIANFLSVFEFDLGSTPNPLNSKRWSDRVISWVDRNIVPLDAFQCTKMKNDLKLRGIELDKVQINECMSSLQFAEPDSTDSRLQIIKDLPRDLMSLDDLNSTLKDNPQLILNLYSGQRDTFVPKENFVEELAKIGHLPNVKYTNFNGSGHDGFRSEPKVWNDLLLKSKVVEPMP